MPPKRKSSDVARDSSLYQVQGSISSKKRLVLNDEEYQDGGPISRSSTNVSNRSAPRMLTSPSLENITTTFHNLEARLSGSAASSVGTPISPDELHIIVPPPPLLQPKLPPPPVRSKTFLILGASRGIGLEFTRQLLSQGQQVIAAVRDPNTAAKLWQVMGSLVSRPGSCMLEQCDLSSPSSIDEFIMRMRLFVERGGTINTIICNAGILEYDKGLGALNVEFELLERHLRVNCVGNIVVARKLLMLNDLSSVVEGRQQQQILRDAENSVVGRQVVFMSSDSGSMGAFREYEDGFAAYAASKVALNMMMRHMVAELKRSAIKKREEVKHDSHSQNSPQLTPWEEEVCILAMHPGEVNTDMANIELGWEVEGVISAEESVGDMLRVLDTKDSSHTGTFWRWDGTEHPW